MNPLLQILFGFRIVMLIGSIGAFVGSLLMFAQGTVHLYEAWHLLTDAHAEAGEVTVPVLEAVDSFLFGVVLVIFSYGIAIGFVFRLPAEIARRLPAWMIIGGVGQLKQILSEVVVVVLIVIFARVVVESLGRFEWTMLVLPIAILMIAAALRLLELHEEEGHGEAKAEPANSDETPTKGH
jgi:uncharacterized membrane protein YqhA